MLCPGENERNEQDDDYGSRDQDRPDVASEQISFSHFSWLYPWPCHSQSTLPAKESSATVLGNSTILCAPSNRSMSPIKARRSYRFGHRSSRRSAHRRCLYSSAMPGSSVTFGIDCSQCRA